MYICIYIYIFIYIYICVYTYVYISTYIRIQIYALYFMHRARLFSSDVPYVHRCTYTYIICIDMYMYVYIFTYIIYIYVYIRSAFSILQASGEALFSSDAPIAARELCGAPVLCPSI